MQWGAKSNSQVSHLCIIWASSLPTAKASISTRGSWGSYLKFVRKTILGHKHLVAIQFSCSVVSDSLWHHGLQHPRLPCPSPTPRASSKLTSITSVMPSSHLILCRPLLLLPSIFPSTRVFSNKSVLHIRWPKYWSFSFSISPSYTGCSTQSQTVTATGPMRKVTRECVLSRFSRDWLFVTLWTGAHQDPLSMGFSRWEYWSHALLQGSSQRQASNLHFTHCSWLLYHWATGEALRGNGHWLYFLIHSECPQMGEYQSSRWKNYKTIHARKQKPNM